MPSPLVLATMLFSVLAVAFALVGLSAIRKSRLLGSTASLLLMMLSLSLAGLCATIAVATQGYRALTREEIAAVIETEPVGRQVFEATVRLPEGGERYFELAGDELYVDAHILKWKPIVNVLGLHTAYELDRIAGRYVALKDERDRPRTVHSLAREKPVDLFALRRRFPFLAPLVDAEYGSATFVPADHSTRTEIRVSTSGLLARPADP